MNLTFPTGGIVLHSQSGTRSAPKASSFPFLRSEEQLRTSSEATEEAKAKAQERPEEKEKDKEEDEENPEKHESTAVFTPVVHLEEVEVVSGEEDEDVLFNKRAKLYIYGESLLNKGTGVKSWNERGLGQMKILKHRETSHIRVLMRQEKTMKVIANHVLDPRIVIVPNSGASEKSWVWNAFDFADGELVEKTFAVRFSDAETATDFKESFTKYQAEMKTVLEGSDDKEATSTEEADEASKAISELSVKKDGEEDKDKKDEAESEKA